MRIHADVLALGHFQQAAVNAGVYVIELDKHGSRSRKNAFSFSLTGSSPYQRGFGARKNGSKAATWDEWGIFLAYLFEIDPNAHCGKHSYESAEDFHWKTGERFAWLSPVNQHKRHKWQPLGMVASNGHCMAVCDCGAEHHWKVVTK